MPFIKNKVEILFTGKKLTSVITTHLVHVAASYHTTMKITSEFRNVGDAAYAMSHLSAKACTQRLAAGHGDGYRLAAATASTARARNWQWSSLLNVNDDQSMQFAKPIDWSGGEAPVLGNVHKWEVLF